MTVLGGPPAALFTADTLSLELGGTRDQTIIHRELTGRLCRVRER